MEGLAFRYPNGQAALQEVSFVLQPGEVVGLLGANGAGKTTLLLHLNGILPGDAGPQTGTIRIQGHSVLPENYRVVRRLVGFLFQDPDDQLFCSTVIEDVAFGPLNLGLDPGEVRDRVTAALQSVGLPGFEDRHTHQLSFGERKRVALAGVLACHPEVLILDEPSSNLDARSRRRFMQILRECRAAQLIASHDLDMIVELCSRVIILDQGRIQAQGETREILTNTTLLSRYGLEVPLSLRLEGFLTPSA